MGRTFCSLVVVLGALLHAQSSKAVARNEFVRHYEPLLLRANSSVVSDDSLVSQFQFRAHGRDFNLHVKTDTDLFHPDFKLWVVGEGGKRERRRVDTRNIVIGHVEGDENSLVRGHIRDRTFDGVIRTKDEIYHVEPITRHLSKRDVDPDLHNTIIYKDSDVVYHFKHSTCSSTQSPKLRLIQESATHAFRHARPAFSKQTRAVDPERNTCTLKVVADYQFFSVVGEGQESMTLAELSLHITDADGIYRSTTFESRNGPISGFGLSILSVEIYTDASNPLAGEYSVEELLEAFSEQNFDGFCLAHLFTYRDFQGTIGLAYVGDPDGRFAGGICQQRTRTLMGELNLNTGFTSLLNFGRRALAHARAWERGYLTTLLALKLPTPIAPSFSLFDYNSTRTWPQPWLASGTEGNFIMFASATDGSRPNNRQFSSCSRDSIGRTIESRGGCFIPQPQMQMCGNGIVEGDEECDCGSIDPVQCDAVDPCCKPGNCTLKEGKDCSAAKSPCCTNCTYSNASRLCLQGDDQCQSNSFCTGVSAECPTAPLKPNGTLCNCNAETEECSNVCLGGICEGTVCMAYNTTSCYCPLEEQLCEVCCIFDGSCISTFDRGGVVNATYVQPGYPCRNFTGYCTLDHVCIFIDNNTPLDDLRDILFDLNSIGNWLKANWYWVLAGFGGLILLVILLQITYRRKKPKREGQQPERHRGRRAAGQTYGFYQAGEQGPLETSGLLENSPRTART